MKKGLTYIALAVLAALLPTACIDNTAGLDCSTSDDMPYVVTGLAFASPAPAEGLTRMSADMVQAGGTFRGLADVRIIPFKTTGKVKGDDKPSLFVVRGVEQRPQQRVYYYPRCSFQKGVASVLFYGRAPQTDKPAEGGRLEAHFPVRDDAPADSIWFRPVPIYTESPDVVPPEAQKIADYLTAIAATPLWSSTSNTDLRTLYQNFIGQGSQLLGGSYRSAKAHAEKLRTSLQALTLTGDAAVLKDSIITRIGTFTGATDVVKDYPASAGLPDGAAVLRWIGNAFYPQTQRTTLADINAINSFVWPAELYYYANSRLLTSTDSILSTDYEQTDKWEKMLTKFRVGAVVADVKAVAVKDSIQYGVADLKVVLQKIKTADGMLEASDGSMVNPGSGYFPLKGVIVSGQRPVGFDFTPLPATDDDDCYVYDSQIPAGCAMSTEKTDSVHTLLLQSPTAQKIQVMLEFENNYGDFKGKDGGIIYKGTRFYLAGTPLVPDKDPQVFTQDKKTTLKADIQSLKAAYNVMPNLQEPRLEIGIVLTPQWQLGEGTDVEMY